MLVKDLLEILKKTNPNLQVHLIIYPPPNETIPAAAVAAYFAGTNRTGLNEFFEIMGKE